MEHGHEDDVFWKQNWKGRRMAHRMLCNGMKYLGETFDIHCGGVDNMFLITKMKQPNPKLQQTRNS
jgi:cysteinyl-tRNA synthetase